MGSLRSLKDPLKWGRIPSCPLARRGRIPSCPLAAGAGYRPALLPAGAGRYPAPLGRRLHRNWRAAAAHGHSFGKAKSSSAICSQLARVSIFGCNDLCHGRARYRINAAMPNPPIASPAKRFIDHRMRSLNRSRKRFTMLPSAIHHAIEPQKIPPARNKVNHHCLWPRMPSAARSARNDSTVVGFVRVKRNVDRL